jgi:L-ascorbate metabolism protein UlaG (beta-lactamase superfamily)
MDDLRHIIGNNTTIVAAKECIDQLKNYRAAETKGVVPGDKLTVQGVQIETVAAYIIPISVSTQKQMERSVLSSL